MNEWSSSGYLILKIKLRSKGIHSSKEEQHCVCVGGGNQLLAYSFNVFVCALMIFVCVHSSKEEQNCV